MHAFIVPAASFVAGAAAYAFVVKKLAPAVASKVNTVATKLAAATAAKK